MIRTLVILAALALPFAAAADCFADYKAKQDGPLRLHYGVVQLPERACGDRQAAWREIAPRLEREGWELLSVEGIFGEDGLERRRQSAGNFFLRF